jgi:hypothetical protein
MLNPVAERSLHANSREMLLGIERDAVGAAGPPGRLGDSEVRGSRRFPRG